VYFGAVRAVVKLASGTNLVVTVPVGATTEPITETVGGLTAYSPQPFIPSFFGNGALISSTNFGPQLNIQAPAGQAGISVADLDGDGKPDLVTANYTANTISIYRNISTNGVLSANFLSAPITLSVAGSVCHVAVGDLDGDGLLDLVADTQSGVACVFKNTSTPGNISFAPYFTITAPADSRYVVIRDIDGDGKPDVIMTGASGSIVSICQNISVPGSLDASSFAPKVDFASGGYQGLSVAIGDLNGDGKPDVIVGDNTALSIFRNTSTPGIIDSNSLAPRLDINHAATIVAIADIDGDGLPDVVTADTQKNTMSVLRNTTVSVTNITVASAVSFTAGTSTSYGVAIGDLNGDGKPDVVTTSPGGNSISVFENQSQIGTVSFGPAANLGTSDGVREVVLADLDGDGRLDIAAVNLNANVFNVYQNLLPFASSPAITTQPTNQAVKVGNTLTFAVVANGAPPLIYQWNLNGTNILGATNSVLDLGSVQLVAAGNYSVIVSNAFGSTVSSNATLLVYAQDHFTWSIIPTTHFVNVPFTVTIQAQDANNGIVTNFTSTVLLSSTNGVPVNPPVSANFSNGLWTGSVTISQLITNLVLRADDGLGEFGLANPINVVSQPSLVASVSGNLLVISWPATVPKFILETTPSLAPASWTQVSVTPLLFDKQYLLSVPISQTNSFFRLQYSGP
jgi:hypothetical protein